MLLEMVRNLILIIGWPVLVGGSIYLIVKGRHVYALVKGSLVGNIVKALVISMLMEMYSLGIVCTFYMFSDPQSAYIVLPIFAVWFVVFIWTLKVLFDAEKKARQLSQPK